MPSISPIILIAVIAGMPAAQATPPIESISAGDELRISLTAGAWLPRLGGTSSLGSGGDELDFQFDLDVDDLEPTFNGELAIQKADRWELMFTGFGFSTSNSERLDRPVEFGNLLIDRGDVARTSVDITSAAMELGFPGWRAPLGNQDRNRSSRGEPLAEIRLVPKLGARFMDIDESIEVGSLREEGDGTWLGVLGGIDLRTQLNLYDCVPFPRDLNVNAGIAGGPALGSDIGFFWQVHVGLNAGISEHVSLQFGYRLLEMNVQNEDFEFNAGLQGLFAGGTIRF